MPQKLANILDQLGTGAAATIKSCGLLSVWADIADERVAKNTEAVKITNRTLFVATSSPVWAQELGFLKKALIQKFNDRAGETAIVDIRFKAGGI